jgi:hypothetical protein
LLIYGDDGKPNDEKQKLSDWRVDDGHFDASKLKTSPDDGRQHTDNPKT